MSGGGGRGRGSGFKDTAGDLDINLTLGYLKTTHKDICKFLGAVKDLISSVITVVAKKDAETLTSVAEHMMAAAIRLELLKVTYGVAMREDGQPIVGTLGTAQGPLVIVTRSMISHSQALGRVRNGMADPSASFLATMVTSKE